MSILRHEENDRTFTYHSCILTNVLRRLISFKQVAINSRIDVWMTSIDGVICKCNSTSSGYIKRYFICEAGRSWQPYSNSSRVFSNWVFLTGPFSRIELQISVHKTQLFMRNSYILRVSPETRILAHRIWNRIVYVSWRNLFQMNDCTLIAVYILL